LNSPPTRRIDGLTTGTEFARRRVSIDLSQKDLAAVLDVSERTVQRWEAAQAVPTIAECALEYLTTIDLDAELAEHT
jgi:DNA-binding transcriptional regulator YiaG